MVTVRITAICALLTGSQRYGQNRYAVTVDPDESADGRLKKQSYVEPWAAEMIAHDDIRDVHTRFGTATMKRVAEGYAKMVFRG